MGWVGRFGLTFDFRLVLPVVTHDRGHSGKTDRFGGMYWAYEEIESPGKLFFFFKFRDRVVVSVVGHLLFLDKRASAV